MFCDTMRNNLRRFVAELFHNQFNDRRDNEFFLFFGRPDPWVNETVPPVNLDTVLSENEAWADAIAFKRVTFADVRLIVPRYDWVTGTVYNEYDDDVDLFKGDLDANDPDEQPRKFYVLVDGLRVYKCLENNNDTLSTVRPTGTGVVPFTTPDGYRWKFLYTIPEDNLRFLTDDFMPIETVDVPQNNERQLQFDVQQVSVDGELDKIEILTKGTAYQAAITIAANVSVQQSQSIGTSVIKLDPGSSTIDNFYRDYVVFIYSGPGIGQIRKIIAYDGTTQIATLDRPWDQALVSDIVPSNSSFYAIFPDVQISGNGTGAQALAFVEDVAGNLLIDRIEMVNSGQDYTTASAIIEVNIDTGTILNPIISPMDGHGSDPVRELGSYRMMIVVRVDQDEQGVFPIDGTFRRVGIVKNPILNDGTGRRAGSEVDRLLEMQLAWDGINPLNTATMQDNEVLIGATTFGTGRVSTQVSGSVVVSGWLPDSLDGGQTGRAVVSGARLDEFQIGEFVNVIGRPANWAVRENVATVTELTELGTLVPEIHAQYHELAVMSDGTVAGQFDPNTYVIGNLARGELSGATGTIVEWFDDTLTDGRIRIVSVSGQFVTQKYTLVRIMSAGAFTIGEVITGGTSGATGTILSDGANSVITVETGTFSPGETLNGTESLATAILTTITQDPTGEAIEMDDGTIVTPSLSTVEGVELPGLINRSGELLYVQHVKPVIRSFEASEEIRILLTF